MNTKTFLSKRVCFIDAVRQYVASQKNLWRQIPWLALQSDGRSGYSERLQRAYLDGHWLIYDANTNNQIACVELATGKLLNWNGRITLDDDFVTVIASDPKQLDASAVISQLKVSMRRKHTSCYDPEKQRAWRSEMIERHGLKRNTS